MRGTDRRERKREKENEGKEPKRLDGERAKEFETGVITYKLNLRSQSFASTLFVMFFIQSLDKSMWTTII